MHSLRYPLSGESPIRTVAVGTVSSSLGLLVLPALVVTGYYGRVLARSSRGDDLPSFEDPGDLLVEGFRTWLAVGAYVAAGVGLVVGFGVAALALGAANTGFGAGVGLLALLTLGLLALGVVAFPAWYFAPAALTRVAHEESARAAFDLRAIKRIVFDRRYFTAWLTGCALLGVGTAGYAGFQFVDFGLPLVGHLLGAGVNFYCQIAAFYCFGRGYAAATDEELPSEAVTPDPAADEAVPEGIGTSADAEREHSSGRRVDSSGRRVDSSGRSEEWGAEAERWRKNRRDGDE